MQQTFLRSTKLELSSKDLHKKLNWISIKRSPPLSELTLYVLSSPSALPMIFASLKSTARTPFSTVEATSSYTSKNLKDLSTTSTRNRSKHLHSWKCHPRRLCRRYPHLQYLRLLLQFRCL